MQTEADPLCQPAASLYAEYVARQNLASRAHELSPEDLRRTWSVVDVLTLLKRNTSHSPTAALIRRKLDALPLPALDKLGCLVDLTILQRHGHHLSTRHYHGFQLAISSFPDDTATEIARPPNRPVSPPVGACKKCRQTPNFMIPLSPPLFIHFFTTPESARLAPSWRVQKAWPEPHTPMNARAAQNSSLAPLKVAASTRERCASPGLV